MTKTIFGFFMFSCGSADVGFSASMSVELDGAVDVRAFGNGGGSGGALTGSGGRADGARPGDSGADTARYCADLPARVAMTGHPKCRERSDCECEWYCNYFANGDGTDGGHFCTRDNLGP